MKLPRIDYRTITIHLEYSGLLHEEKNRIFGTTNLKLTKTQLEQLRMVSKNFKDRKLFAGGLLDLMFSVEELAK